MPSQLKRAYVAGPLFSEAERAYLEKLVSFLAANTSLDPDADFFLPHRDAGDMGVGGSKEFLFAEDLRRLEEAQFVVALLDGADVDSGTAAEIGYAHARGKPVFGLLTDFRAYGAAQGSPWRFNNMVWGICNEGKSVFRDQEALAAALVSYLEGGP